MIQARTGWRNAERLMFFGLLAVSLVPILVSSHFPSEDGPMHVANAAIYRFSESPLFQEWYTTSWDPIPNMATDALMSLMLGFLGAELTQKVMAVLLAVGLPLAFRWCLAAVNRDAVWMAALVIPVAHGRFLYNGYWNFEMALVLALVTLGYWMRFMRTGERTPMRWAGAVLLFLVTYLSHIVPFLLLLAMTGAVVVDEAMEDGSKGRRLLTMVRRYGAVLLAAAIPIALYLRFQTGIESSILYTTGPLRRLVLFPGYAVVALGGYEIPPAGLLVVAVVALTIRSLWRPTRWQQPGFLILTAALLVGFFVVPDIVGNGSDVAQRFAVFITILPLLWVAREPFDRRIGIAGLGVAVVVVLGLAAVRLPAHAVLDEDISEYLSGREVVEEGSAVLPLWMSPIEEGRGPGGGQRVVEPLVELAGLLMADGDVIDLHHLPPAIDIFPFRFRDGLDIRESASPDPNVYPFRFGPGMVDIEEYVEDGGRVDYIWLWGRNDPDPEALASQHARSVLEYIDAHYEVVFVSEPRGMLEVYARK